MTWLLLEEIWYSAVLHSRGGWNYMGEGGRGEGGLEAFSKKLGLPYYLVYLACSLSSIFLCLFYVH